MFGDPYRNEKRWNYKKIGALFANISRGKQPSYVEDSNVRVINQACIYWDKINLEKVKYHDINSSKNYIIVSPGDLLINSTGTGTLGRCNVVPNFCDDNIYIVDSHVTVLQNSKEIDAIFFKWLLNYKGIQKDFYIQCVNGSTNQIELSKEKLRNYMIIVPPLDLQNQFADFVAQVDKSKLVVQRGAWLAGLFIKTIHYIESMHNKFHSDRRG